MPPPSGTVTFLFTDIEGSTRAWEEQSGVMRAALAVHDELVRHAIEAHSGHLVKSTGDGAFVVFGSADEGVGAAVAAQLALVEADWPGDVALRVRMGLHIGPATELQLLGRVTYEGFAAAWPSREGEFADKLNKEPKYVVSTTIVDPKWQNTTVISENVAEKIAKLKEQTRGVVLVADSGKLVEALLANDLVDELRLMVFPTILGRGKRLFPDGIDRLKLRLADTRTLGRDGVQVQIYERAWESRERSNSQCNRPRTGTSGSVNRFVTSPQPSWDM